MSIFFGTTNSGIVLGTGTYTNPLTVTSFGYVGNTTTAHNGDAVYGPTGTAWAVSNYGTIKATGGASQGVVFEAGGSIRNGQSGSTAGMISGYHRGVAIYGAAGTVTNYGTIKNTVTTGFEGIILVAGGSVHNAGMILGGGNGSGDALRINAGSIIVTNSGTMIGGGSGIASYAGGTVTNSAGGLIEGNRDNGIAFQAFATVINSGTLEVASTSTNTASNGIYFNPGGYARNNSGALIRGVGYGVHVVGGAGTVGNLGTIAATGSSGRGIKLAVGGSVGNSGRIVGVDSGVDISGAAGTVSNSGTIAASGTSSRGVRMTFGGYLGNAAGGTISGIASGVYFNLVGAGTVVNYGAIAATGAFGISVQLNGGGTVTNYGTITSTGDGGVAVYLSQGGVTNTGGGRILATASNDSAFGVVIAAAGGNVANYATIQGAGTGVWLKGGGIIGNSGSIAGSGASGVGVRFGTGAGGTATLVNTGTITGTAIGAMFYGAGGTLINGGIDTSGVIEGYTGVKFFFAAGTVTNDGVINATGAGGNGVYLKVGGGVYNSGLISGGNDVVHVEGAVGTVANTGAIAASNGTGIWLNGAGGTVINSGLVTGTNDVIFTGNGRGTVINSGSIIDTGGSGAGIGLDAGGFVTNSATGFISAPSIGVEVKNSSGTFVNLGTVVSVTGKGVSLYAGGSVSNAGAIAGYSNGVVVGGASGNVANFGTITATGTSGDGAYLQAGGFVTNASTGLITGYDGVRIFGGGGTLINSGSIVSTGTGFGAQGVDFLGGGTLTNFGSILGVGYHASGINAGFAADLIVNGGSSNSTALIAGWLNGIDQFSFAGSVINFGTVLSSNGAGVSLAAGGSVHNSGAIAGVNNGVVVGGSSGSVANYGTIRATGSFGASVYLAAGGGVSNGSSASTAALIVGNSNAVAIFNAPGSVTNYGTIAAIGSAGYGVVISSLGTVANFGTILETGTGGAGVRLGGGGLLTNSAGGLIDGMSFAAAIFGASGSVLNHGRITAAGGASPTALYLAAGGSVANYATISAAGGNSIGANLAAGGTLTNAVGGLIFGSSEGVLISGAAGGRVANYGSIGGAYDGVLLKAAGGTVFNAGSIVGAASYGLYLYAGGKATNAAGGLMAGRYAGVIVTHSAGVVGNLGSIAATGGSGVGAVFKVAGSTLTNAGAITGSAGAVAFAGSGNRLIVNPGAAFSGLVDGGAAGNTLELGSAVGKGTLSSLGTNYLHFDTIALDAAASWLLTGKNLLAAGTTLSDAGVLTVSGNLTNNGKIDIANGATLDLVNGDSGGGTIALFGSGDLLRIGATGTPAALANAITGFAPGDTIDLKGIGLAASFSFSSGILRLKDAGGSQLAQLTLSTPVTYPGFSLASDGGDGTNVQVFPMAIFTGTYLNGIILNNPTTQNPSTVTSSGYVTNQSTAVAGDAVFGTNAAAWNFSNFGTINAPQATASGVHFLAGGTIVNGAATATSALIVGALNGVLVSGGAGTVSNFGTIVKTGTNPGQAVNLVGGGMVANYGTITTVGTNGSGIIAGAGGATVINGSTSFTAALISGYAFGIDNFSGVSTVINFGTIRSSETVTPASTAFGTGVLINSGTIANFGTIIAAAVTNGVGVQLNAGGTVVNGSAVAPGALISASNEGVALAGTVAATVVNFGTIAATATNASGINVFGGAADSVVNFGTVVGNGTGGHGIRVTGGAGTVTNLGTVIGSPNNGVYFGAGGIVVNGAANATSALITGSLASAVIMYNVPGTVVNYGTLLQTGQGTAGQGVNIRAGGVVTNASSGLISSYHSGVVATTGAATVVNYGRIQSTGTGFSSVNLAAGGTVTNGGTGSTAALIVSQSTGVNISGGAGTVSNSGLILALGSIVNASGSITGGTGVSLNNGGILTNNATGLIEGYHIGVSSGTAATTVVNFGTISSRQNASNGFSGVGVQLSGGGSVNNSGLIAGQFGVNFAGTIGPGTVINSGTILGATTGTSGGAVALNNGGLVINSGLMESDRDVRVIGSLTGHGGVVTTSTVSATILNLGTISTPGTNASTGINLLHGGLIVNGATNNTTALISGSSNGIYAGGHIATTGTLYYYPGATASITNYGTIQSTGTSSAVVVVSGGSVVNRGLISSGAASGVVFKSITGTVTNFGTIVHGGPGTSGEAVYLGAGGILSNFGLISGANGTPASGSVGGYPGVVEANNVAITLNNQGTITNPLNSNGVNMLQGGLLVNGSTANTAASIYAPRAGIYMGGRRGTAYSGATGTVTNYGTIKNGSSASQAVRLVSGGTVLNRGLIISPRTGISFGGSVSGTVDNFGTVISTAAASFTAGTGAYLQAGGIITNEAGGTIQAVRGGVSANGSATTVANYGTIASTGAGFYGVQLAAGGSILNGTTGVISGGAGVAATGTASATVSNLGTISGVSLNGVTLAGGGLVSNGAVVGGARGIGGGAAVSGAWINGAAVGVSIGGGTAAGGVVVNFSTITGATGGAAFFTNGTIVNDTAGFIAGGYGVGSGAGGTRSAIYNLGTIIGNASRGIQVTSGGTVSNGAGGLIAGVTGGIYASGAGLAVNNSGTIFSTASRGVSLAAGGTLNNGGIVAGAGGGAYFFGGAGTLTNGGTIASTGASFDGVYLAAGGAVNNGGLIAGLDAIDFRGSGSIGNSGTIVGFGSGNVGGVFLGFNYSPGAFQVTNTGLITSTATAVLMRGAGIVTNAAGGVITGNEFAIQVFGASTIVNFGTISSAAGTAGTAIRLGPAADVVVIEQGSVLTGVIANFGSGDTIDLPFIPFSAGDTATLDANNLLTVSGGGKTAAVQLDSAVAGKLFVVVNDGSGGADVQLQGPPPPPVPTGLALAAASDSGLKGDNVTNITGPTIIGTGEAGDSLTLFDGGVVVGSGTVLADSTWAVSTTALSAGMHTLTASEKNTGGNVSGVSTPLSITIDLSAPSASPATLTVPNNSGPTSIGIAAPSDIDNPAASLTIVVSALPSNGTVTLSDGTTAVTIGQTLSIAQLTQLKFSPGVGLIGTSSSFVYSVTDIAGNATTGTATLKVGANSQANLFNFLFTYKDGKDYYAGSVADDGSFGYSVGQTIATSAGQYTVFAKASVTSQAAGTVFVAAYSHNAPGAASPIPVNTATGKADGSNGLGSESDAVLGVDGKTHPFSSTLEANFATTNLFGFVYTYADGLSYYTGNVADDGSAGLTDGSLSVTDGFGNLVGTYAIFREGPTGRAAGTVVIDRFLTGGASFIALHAGSSGIDGVGGLKSEAASFVSRGATLPFSDTQEPVVPSSLATAPVIPAPNAGDVITQELNEIYRAVLGRAPDTSGLATYSALLASGTSAVTIRAIIAGSAEARNDINQLYHQIFARDGDTGGLNTYSAFLATGGSLAGIQLILAQSSEARNAIAQIYLDVLNRPADSGGLATYSAILGDETPGNLADPGGRPGLDGIRDIIAHSPEAGDGLTGLFRSVLNRPPGAAELIGMEDQLANAGVTQTTLQNALANTGSAGGFSVVTAGPGSTTLPAASNVPALFVFNDIAFGHDTITGFDIVRDTIQLPTSIVTDFTKLQSETTNSGGGSLITLNSSQSILVAGVAPANLGTANFRFA